MTTAISTLIDEVAADLVGAPVPTIERQFQRVMVDFCQRTWAWQEVLSPMTAFKDRSVYQAKPDTKLDAKIMGVLDMYHRDKHVTATTEADLDRFWPRWREAQESYATYFVPRQYGEFLLVAKPDETIPRSITDIRVSLYPERANTKIPDSLVDAWFETLLDGVRSRMMRMPGREWSNLQLASVAEQEYDAGVNNAKYRGVQGWGPANHVAPKRPLSGMP